ncbi:retinoid-inducible serine carboxypeptidase-like [Microplitis mediator]|uniref:retinoid-inducible serine carboxypeptidase-like n=1 Tax=Microplitis mediator TaxID=375433 RepID=UPI00255721BE|nr:retinoid-inducible serine carboxypeptidase-like [Microplitis mediator]
MIKWLMIYLQLCLVYGSNGIGREGFGPGKQDWGYVTVRPGAHMFWWLYYVSPTVQSKNFNVFERPLIIWLQGGPGESGTGYGNLNELGPLDINLERRNHTWVNDYNVLFIDNPVSVGFSYVDNVSAIAKNMAQIADDLLELIKGFLKTIPSFINVPTYVVGESFGGNMAVEFALLWFKGLVDTVNSIKIEAIAQETIKLLDEERWAHALNKYRNMYFDIYNITADISMYNVLQPKKLTTFHAHKYFTNFRLPLNEVDVDKQIEKVMKKVKTELNHDVDRNYTLFSKQVWKGLSNELMKPVTNTVEQLLNKTDLKVFVYTGQLDLIVPTTSTVSWVEKLKWKYANDWNNAIRVSFTVDNIVEGYVKEYGNLKLYWIDRSGHMVPKDNPYAINAMLQDLTSLS